MGIYANYCTSYRVSYYFLCVIVLILFIAPLVQPSNSCAKEKSRHMDVFFVNLDRSTERRANMIHQLEFYGLIASDKLSLSRVAAITPDDFIIPPQIITPFHCSQLSNDSISSLTTLSPYANGSAYMLVKAHCGRPRNTKRDMAVTISHLLAIKAATDNIQSADSKYALILEDDIELAYDIDFDKLIESAPRNWGILQLITSNSYDITQLWQQYKSQGLIWTLRTYQDLWCAGGYIINKDMMRPIVNGIFQPLPNGWIGVNIIAGYDKPCTPAFCCLMKGAGLSLIPPCIRSPRGYQSDHFIFSMIDQGSYILHVPILTGSHTGNVSTLHQDHVGLHVEAFRRINMHVEALRSGEAEAPVFIHDKQCRFVSSAAMNKNAMVHMNSSNSHPHHSKRLHPHGHAHTASGKQRRHDSGIINNNKLQDLAKLE